MMAAEFEIDMSMFDDVVEHLPKGCKIKMDLLVMVSCSDGWFVLDQFKDFLGAMDSKISGN